MGLKLSLSPAAHFPPEMPGAFEPLGEALTTHARARMRQRGIRAQDLAWILDYGRGAKWSPSGTGSGASIALDVTSGRSRRIA